MKKLLLPFLFLLLVLPAMSLNLATVSGTVTDLSTGNPIPNQAVIITNDSAAGWIYYQTVYTNINGFYLDTIPVPVNTQGILYVRTIDCQNYQHQVVLTFTPSSLNFTADFSICYNSNPCLANFTTSLLPPLSVQFNDASMGGGNTRYWYFGDGATSTDLNPMHTYSAEGYYTVHLTIGAIGTTCFDTTVQTVHVWDSTGGGGCHAMFSMYPDSSNSTLIYQFVDHSTGNINSWSWNFNDPASGVNNTSTLQNPIHAYTQPGLYTPCLTIHSVNNTCTDMTCPTFTVYPPSSCHAEFNYYADTVNLTNEVHFIDMSTAGTGTINTWTWIFGDGAVETVTSPGNPNIVHTYAHPGTYYACLTIHGSDSTCYNTTCHTLVVGTPPPCQAAFTYYTDSLSSGQTIHFIDQSTGNIASWNWNFGDGSSSVEQNPVHTYTTTGHFPVSLTVASPNQSCFNTITDTIYVGITPGCQAYFSYTTTIDPGTGQHSVAFTDLSAGNPVTWLWSFGDGTSGTVQNPVHIYATAGTYNVCLTIASNNCTSIYCHNVVVPDSISYHQVYGQVFAGNFPISLGLAMIFSFDTTANYQPFVATCPIDSNGVYYFTQVPNGHYYILALPFDSNGYLPTYYGNTITWEQAILITLGTPANPYNINLIQSDQMTAGPGSTSGLINAGDMANSLIDKINMILKNEQGNPIGYTQVSSTGAFSFPSLAYGTYYLHPEMPGVTSDQVKIVLSAQKPHADVTMTFTGKSILGIGEKVSLANSWSVYPNPVIDNMRVNIDMKKDVKAVLDIYNLTGQMVVSTPVILKTGNNNIEVSTASLSQGVYSLQIKSSVGFILTSKIVKTR